MKAKYQIYLKLLKSALFSKMETNLSSRTTVPYLCDQAFRKYLKKLSVYNRLMSYLTNSNILINNQFGFRNRYSTAMAVIDMVDKISDAIDNKYYSLGVFVLLRLCGSVTWSSVVTPDGKPPTHPIILETS